MFKKVFELFEPTEAQFKPGALRRLKYASVLSFFLVPLLGAHYLLPKSESMTSLSMIALILAIIGLIPFTMALGSRLINRAWTPDKYLDESEIARKRDSATFAFIYVNAIAMVVVGFWLLWVGLRLPLPEFAQSSGFGLYMICIYISSSFCLQAYRIASITADLDMEDEGPKKVPADRKIVLYGIIIIALSVVIGFSMGYFVGH